MCVKLDLGIKVEILPGGQERQPAGRRDLAPLSRY
jgi:hypothetical protein